MIAGLSWTRKSTLGGVALKTAALVAGGSRRRGRSAPLVAQRSRLELLSTSRAADEDQAITLRDVQVAGGPRRSRSHEGRLRSGRRRGAEELLLTPLAHPRSPT